MKPGPVPILRAIFDIFSGNASEMAYPPQSARFKLQWIVYSIKSFMKTFFQMEAAGAKPVETLYKALWAFGRFLKDYGPVIHF